jgi:hypothetical protein
MGHFRDFVSKGRRIRDVSLDCLIIPVFKSMDPYVAQHGSSQCLKYARIVSVMKLLIQMSVTWAMAIAKYANMVLTGFRPTLRHPICISVRHPEKNRMLLAFQL